MMGAVDWGATRRELRGWALAALWPLGWAAAAYAARLLWVEAQGLAVACQVQGSDWPCPARQAVIEAFLNHRLSTIAGALAVLAWLAPRVLQRPAGWAGLGVAACGLVLYDADRSALAALACAAALLPRTGRSG